VRIRLLYAINKYFDFDFGGFVVRQRGVLSQWGFIVGGSVADPSSWTNLLK